MLDAECTTVLDEVIINGHEPRPAEHYYPRLAGDQQLCTDILFFERLRDVIVFVHRIDGGSGLRGWKDQLLCFSAKALLGRLRT